MVKTGWKLGTITYTQNIAKIPMRTLKCRWVDFGEKNYAILSRDDYNPRRVN